MNIITKYQCGICGEMYDKINEAEACESIGRLRDKGVDVGDVVKILSGECTGYEAVVTHVGVTKRGWGPEFLDHTVYVSADVLGSWGSRQLDFMAYELVRKDVAK